MPGHYPVTWDFPRKPSGMFYGILSQELGISHPRGNYPLIQKSVALCCDDFIAGQLSALAEHFGAKVTCFSIASTGLAEETQQSTREFVIRVLQARLGHRGKKIQSEVSHADQISVWLVPPES